ncbi:MAG: ABC transporter, ATP-binding protein (cluster 5, nickel/peptides/opines) / ABC transporter, ATP-binding protein (cluster 5, nickel/peptides/opines) [uncultured Thermoleophilia bacterium]|uniref:ABC transporter, ATP-binding protein (Cluster 5, nickel/peptides/opines) / ABC transporter, ATP-binding protein (Cluster 5, nickel/peptides/opines) n=1 Tax=uncultured Thermoleophilia bacterium TaxID=1497501 RepID=A0A6J4TZ74_9ACTN|nr:MAG: ABC transporter, ATP-binding protein (cluster 5, nickel/peptides/opines) / ABC transporter, ATP-binding protein (cluster 5, nickel/peptides/opines) [uncultured Thermoleophilia bacterium]
MTDVGHDRPGPVAGRGGVKEAAAAITVEDLRVELRRTGHDIVADIGFRIGPGEVLGLVGESGSGKTTAGLALLGHTRRGVRIASGSVRIGDTDVLRLPPAALRRLRGGLISYVPQDPSASLNPAVRIGTQLLETLEAHGFGSGSDERRARVTELMAEVALPTEARYLRRYPHELSGGQQQRVGLAMAFANRPRLIVLDEPTTGLDVSTQAHVLTTVRDLAATHGTAALYVTHDLAVVAAIADRLAVMYAGRIVEEGGTTAIFDQPAHPYTRRLIAAIPHLGGRRELQGIPGRAPSPGSRPPGCFFAPRCSMHVPACDDGQPALREVVPDRRARCIRAEEVLTLPPPTAGRSTTADEPSTADAVLRLRSVCCAYGPVQVLHDIDLDLAPGECLALVGESGSGKTTLARSIAGLHKDRTGEILFDGHPLEGPARARAQDDRRRVQYIFQSPYSSLNPRRTVGQAVSRPLEIFGTARGREAEQKATAMLDLVSLGKNYLDRYPDELSGGERQRVAIARALVCEPAVLICDEVTSALDVSVQAAIVDLLARLQRDLGLSMLFVTHNLPLVRSIAGRVAVMSLGRIVELGTVDRVLRDPRDAYTQRLLADTPSLETASA